MSTPYKIIQSKRKTVSIRVLADGTLEVRCPLHMSQQQVEEIVNLHQKWIETQQKKLQSQPLFKRQFVPGEIFFYLGEAYPLRFTEKKHLEWNGEYFFFPMSSSAQGKELFEKWYKKQARMIIQERVDFYGTRYHFSYQSIRITAAKQRLGSCSRHNSLNFTWLLIFLPLELIDYVVVHELVHTRYKHHQKSFWKAVEAILPDYKIRQKKLKNTFFSHYWFV
jgi:hypothetical protein